jgi:DNA-binding transcriptional MerR regulator
MEQQRTYSIGSVAIMMGVPKYKLRHWCERYLPYTQKIDIGNMQHRRFTGKDSEWIKTIKGYGDGGFTLDAAISQAREHLDGDKCFSLRRTRMQGRALRPPFTLCLGREENRESRAAGDVAVMSALAVFARVDVAGTGSAVFLQKTAPGGFHVELKPIFLSKDDHPEQIGAFTSRVKIKRPLC